MSLDPYLMFAIPKFGALSCDGATPLSCDQNGSWRRGTACAHNPLPVVIPLRQQPDEIAHIRR